jgi:glycosyltransferase involved in cell wall biosynthesis
MLVLHLNHFASLVGGTESYIQNVSLELERAEWESHLLYSHDDPGPYFMSNVEQVNLPSWSESNSGSYDSLSRVLERMEPNVVMVHSVDNPYVVAWLADRVPTLVYVHGLEFICPGSAKYFRSSQRPCTISAGAKCFLYAQLEGCCWGRNPLKHLRALKRTRAFESVYRSLRTIIVGSEFVASLLSDAGIASDTIHVLAPILVDETTSVKQASSVSSRILFAGRLVPEKGVEQLLHAVSRIDLDFQLDIAGTGPEMGSYRELVERLGLTEKVKFLGQIGRGQMNDLYRTCAFAVVPSMWPEPFGRVGPEAAANARPAIAFDVGGVGEWIEDGVSGFLVRRGDIDELAKKMSHLLAEPNLARRMGASARARALTKWNSRQHVDRLQALLLGLPGRDNRAI